MAISVTTNNEQITAAVTDEKVTATVSPASAVSATVTAGFGATGPAGPPGATTWSDITGKPATFPPPVATSSVLGGVKEGANTTIAEDGTISVAAPYSLPIATPLTVGGIRLGTGLDYEPSGIVYVVYGASSGTACEGNDSRLTNARTPSSHVHGNITNAGAIGSTSGRIVVTTTSGVLTTAASIALSQISQSSATTGQVVAWNGTAWAPAAGGGYTLPNATTSTLGGVIVGTGLGVTTGTVSVSYGTLSSTACVGNDARLSDSREWSAATVTQADAEAGTSTTRFAFTPLRVFQAIAAWWAASSAKTKLDGIATGATANSSDATLLARANHTGTQAASTITGLGSLATQSGTFSGTSSGTNTGDQTITLTGDVTGSGTGSFAATLSSTGVSAGTYTSVTVDAKGRVTSGSSPAVAYSSLSGVPSTFAPSSHTHPLSELSQSGATTNQVPQWNGSAWVPATVSGGGGGGSSSASDLTSGTLADARLSDKARAADNLYLWSNFR
jgi:hypothetical protein